MSQTVYKKIKKTVRETKRFKVFKLSCVLLCAQVHPASLFDTTTSVWEKTSLQATVVSMVTGRGVLRL